MEKLKYPKTYQGFLTKDLLRTWEEIKSPKGTQAPPEQISVLQEFLKKYRLAVFKKR